MESRKISILTAGLILGLGWAIRGSFGHEWGAAWAGGLVGIAIIGFSKREDWLKRAPVLTVLAAIGWGIGGMMSYGMVVGYCKGNDFINVYYGYTMLAIIGGLYGFFGGGLFALGLETTDEKPMDWPRIVTEMFIGGFLFWGFFIFQLEWFMTPPRSELWAGCAGAAIALTWFMYREGYSKSLRVAEFSALGAGIGFAFGNFMQVIGTKAGANYNLWNVMEFTLGLLGGLGMAYAVFTTTWPQSAKPTKKGNWIALSVLIVVLPLINYSEQFGLKKLIDSASNHPNFTNPEAVAYSQFIMASVILGLFIFGGFLFWKKFENKPNLSASVFVPISMFGFALFYTLFGVVKNTTFLKLWDFSNSTATYIPILIITYLIWHFKLKAGEMEFNSSHQVESTKYWMGIVVFLLIGILILTFLSINLFDVQLETNKRF